MTEARGPLRLPATQPTGKRAREGTAPVDAGTIARANRALRWHAARAAANTQPLLELVPDSDTPGINEQ